MTLERSFIPQALLLLPYVVRVLMALAASFDATAVARTTPGSVGAVQQRVATVRFALAVLEPARVPADAHFQRADAGGPDGGHVAAPGWWAARGYRWERLDRRLQNRDGGTCRNFAIASAVMKSPF